MFHVPAGVNEKTPRPVPTAEGSAAQRAGEGRAGGQKVDGHHLRLQTGTDDEDEEKEEEKKEGLLFFFVHHAPGGWWRTRLMSVLLLLLLLLLRSALS